MQLTPSRNTYIVFSHYFAYFVFNLYTKFYHTKQGNIEITIQFFIQLVGRLRMHLIKRK